VAGVQDSVMALASALLPNFGEELLCTWAAPPSVHWVLVLLGICAAILKTHYGEMVLQVALFSS
jgi:hypothetical protein